MHAGFISPVWWFCFLAGVPCIGAVSAERVHRLRGRGSHSLRAAADENWYYNKNGANWLGLGNCGNGPQSPMNTTGVPSIDDDGQKVFFQFPVHKGEAIVQNTRSGLVVALRARGAFHVGAAFPDDLTASYSLKEIRIHLPSEHLFNGKRAAMELQLHHVDVLTGTSRNRSMAPTTAVVAVGFEQTPHSTHPFLQTLLQRDLPLHRSSQRRVNEHPMSMDFSKLFGAKYAAPVDAALLEYEGSLTTPPCSQGVRWFLRQGVLPVSNPDLEKFRQATISSMEYGLQVSGNVRQLQAPFGRSVIPRAVVTVRAASDAPGSARPTRARNHSSTEAHTAVHAAVNFTGPGIPDAFRSLPDVQVAIEDKKAEKERVEKQQAERRAREEEEKSQARSEREAEDQSDDDESDEEESHRAKKTSTKEKRRKPFSIAPHQAKGPCCPPLVALRVERDQAAQRATAYCQDVQALQQELQASFATDSGVIVEEQRALRQALAVQTMSCSSYSEAADAMRAQVLVAENECKGCA